MRTPLRPPPSSTPNASPTPNMPLDKQKSGAPTKPFTPTLSSNFRTPKSTLTPRLAGSAQSTPVNTPRRGLQTAPNGSPAVQPRVAPVVGNSPNLNGNITPRSGARRSRAFDSPSTPNGTDSTTHVSSRPTSVIIPTTGQDGHGLGILDQDTQFVSDGPRFFHADDAKSSVSTHEPEVRPKVLQKKSTFFYASGETEGGGNAAITSTTSLPGRSVRPNIIAQASPPIKSPPSTNSSPVFPSPNIPRKAPLRPPSPLKESSFRSAPGGLQHAKSQPVHPRSPPLGAKNPIETAPSRRQRQTSLGGSTQSLITNHRKSLSNSSQRSQKSISAENIKSRKSSLTSSSQPNMALQMSASSLPSPTATITMEQKRRSLPPSIEGDTPISTNTEAAAPSQIQAANELAANARRERKVLDLEISNSSLLAINRTLEREMRKQSAEIRRFRRLSRAGRLSIAASSMRSVSGESGLSTLAESEDATLSDLEEHSEFDEEEDLESSLDDSEIANLSPEAQAELDSRHRARDERRLQLDLSKHQQILIDSQKMNQSIRRCMAWTDELIMEGRKALEYQVRVSDVQLGGRVLSAEEETPETRKGLLSPSTTMNAFEEMQMWADKLKDLQITPLGNIQGALQGPDDALSLVEKPTPDYFTS